MGKFRSWNDRGKCMNVWERKYGIYHTANA